VGTLYLSTVGREEFYARLGWQVVDRREDEIVMSKPRGGSPVGDYSGPHFSGSLLSAGSTSQQLCSSPLHEFIRAIETGWGAFVVR
jgi:hypothetical protein